MNQSARFWHFHSGSPVLIKIAAGQSLHHSHFGPTDEGFHSETSVWSFDGYVLTSEYYSDSRDCDGRISHHAQSTCCADELKAGYVDPDFCGIAYPAWQHTIRGQRDYSAEAAGY